MNIIIIILALWNTVLMFLYGIDKMRARKGVWRISENMLIIPSFFFGGIGAMLGMIIFNHKTSKAKFRFLIPLAFFVNLMSAYLITKGYWTC